MRVTNPTPRLASLLFFFVLAAALPVVADDAPRLPQDRRVVFLGDSITHAGGYIQYIEAYLATRHADRNYQLLNLGLPSETACGLSEPYHPFPRPNVHERLGRALQKLQPALVIACYGMNDGIYHPFSDDRFQQYKRGITKLVTDCRQAGAEIILLTPPPFDALPVRDRVRPKDAKEFGYRDIYAHYDREVLARYANWIMLQSQREDVAAAIDLHTPVNEYLSESRAQDPAFRMSRDGVHINDAGHRLLASVLLKAFGFDRVDATLDNLKPDVRDLVRQRHVLLHNAWLTEVGHKRPGVRKGEPIDSAVRQSKRITAQIRDLD